MWSQLSRRGREGASETGDVGSWDVTLGCAANSAATFFYTLQWIQPTPARTISYTLSLSHTLQKLVSLGVK